MSSNKNIYIGAMSGTSHDAIDVSILKIEKDITLDFFHSKRIPNLLRNRIRQDCVHEIREYRHLHFVREHIR